MQQRQPRLGDILDDYCPRERRITNHAVVAMIDQEVRQTRCTTCDADHEYKHAKVPPARKKKDAVSAAYTEVLASVQQDAPAGAIRLADPPDERSASRRRDATPEVVPESEPVQPQETKAPAADQGGSEAPPDAEVTEDAPAQDEGPVHRRLIRATLPRTTDTPVTRPAPQFTMREPAPRGGHFRSKGGNRPHQGGGPRPHGRMAGPKHAGSRKGGFGPHPRPSRPGHGAHASRPGKKHSK